MIEKRRNCNIELLRVVAIIFIITHHCVINGYGLQSGLLANTLGKNELYYLSIINSFVIIGVNIFFLISGYYGIRFSIKKFTTLVVNLYIYNFVLYVIAFIGGGGWNLFALIVLNIFFFQYTSTGLSLFI